jgi:hypothetical protein
VGLNPQEPVASQTIIDTFLGIMFGMFIGTVLGRLLWPVLPQRVLRDNLLMVLAQIKALLNGDPHREKIQTQLAMLPVEALQAARQIRIAGCSEEERNRLADLPLEAPLRVLDLVERYHASAEALEECGRLVRTLEIQRYWGDYAL